MPVEIKERIVKYEVVEETPDPAGEDLIDSRKEANIVSISPLLARPEELYGSTYKIKTPLSDHALYITINDVVINSGTDQEHLQPFEIFINSKNMENFSWIVALTRVISAVFRKGGDVTFLVEELRSVFDPRGGYFKKGGKYMPSLVAEIGECIETHLIKIGMIDQESSPEELVAKREQAERLGLSGERQCPKCGEMSVVRLDNCDTCLGCGHSKCG